LHTEWVIIGVDPDKLSATIEAVDPHEKALRTGRFTTTRLAYAAMRSYAKPWPYG
jgi:transposase